MPQTRWRSHQRRGRNGTYRNPQPVGTPNRCPFAPPRAPGHSCQDLADGQHGALGGCAPRSQPGALLPVVRSVPLRPSTPRESVVYVIELPKQSSYDAVRGVSEAGDQSCCLRYARQQRQNQRGSGRGIGFAKSRQAFPGLTSSGDAELQLSVRCPPSTPLRQRPDRTYV